MRMLSLLSLCFTACAGGSTDPTGDPGLEDVTYYPDVQPIIDAQCTRCHQPGGVGPFDFSTPETFSTFADRALARIDEGTMPPAVADPDCQPYVGQEHMNVPDGTADLLRAWIAAGKPIGDPADAVEIEPLTDTLDEVDLEVRMEAPYTAAFADTRNPGNEYRCFYLDPGDEDIYISALHPIVDNTAMVHHAVLFTVPDAAVPQGVGPEGLDCIDNSAVNGMIAGWAPGMLPVELPEGAAIKVGAAQTLVLQMHYYDDGSGGSHVDQSGYSFDLVEADQVRDEVFMMPFGSFNFNIPAGDEAYSHSTSQTFPRGFSGAKLYGTFPHMHVLGSGYRMWVERGEGGEDCLAESDRYDFENQMTYMFPEPIDVAGGDTLHLECTWNNSSSNPDLIHDPPKDTRYGERTDEEMCFAFTLVSL